MGAASGEGLVRVGDADTLAGAGAGGGGGGGGAAATGTTNAIIEGASGTETPPRNGAATTTAVAPRWSAQEATSEPAPPRGTPGRGSLIDSNMRHRGVLESRDRDALVTSL